MGRNGLAVAAFLFASLHALAQDTRTVTEPMFPPVCTVLTAQLSAGPTGLPFSSETLLDTTRIQAALNACAPGKAVELQADGPNNAYLIAPISLPKGVTLLVDAGVTVFASRNPRDYDTGSSRRCGTVNAVGGGCLPLVSVNKADGAGIMGYGAIDGRGHLPMLAGNAPSTTAWWDLLAQAQPLGVTVSRSEILRVADTNNFTLYKITLMNSPAFHVDLQNVNGFTAWGIKIITPYDAPNTDGIDPRFSSDVTIRDSYISCGDDHVAIKAENAPGSGRISVVNNHFGDGMGASIGSVTQAGVRNVVFDRIWIAGSSAYPARHGIRIKSDVSGGGLVENVLYSNICMKDVHDPISIDAFYTASAQGNSIPQYKNVTLQNVRSLTEGWIRIQGRDATVPTTIVLNNVQVDNVKSSDITQQYTQYTLGPDPVNFASMLKGTGVTVTNNIGNSNAPYSCPASVFSPIAGELIPGPPLIAAAQNLTVMVQVFPTKAIPYQTYLTNLKTNPNATLALPAPTGTVTIRDGTASLGTATLNGEKLLSIPLGRLIPGKHTLTATYSGDGNYASITFGNYQLTVDRFASTAVLAASTATASAGDSLTLKATVTGESGTPTGTVIFAYGDTKLTSVALDSNGQATYTANAVPGGLYSFSAAYSGDAIFNGSISGAVAVTVSPANSTVALNLDAAQHAVGEDAVFAARVNPASSNAFVPTGTVDFTDGSTKLGTVILDGNGSARYTTNSLAPGLHSITVAYSGDVNFSTSNSVPAVVEVLAASPPTLNAEAMP